MTSLRSALRKLLALSLGLPIVVAVLTWVSSLMAAMGDAAGAGVLDRVKLAAGVLWLLALVGLVLVLGLLNLDDASGAPAKNDPSKIPPSELPPSDYP